MARSIYDMCSNARTRLGDPRSQTPSDSQLLQQACSHIRTLKRAKRNVSNPWEFGDTFVDITPGEGTYQITDASFGTPLCVMTVPENDNQVVRLVPFYCPQNLNYSWGLPVNAGSWGTWSWDGSNCNAARCSIYWKNNQAYIEFLPIPQLSPAQYQIRFLQSANLVGIASLNAEPLPDEDCDVVECRMAKSLLGLTEWESSSTKDGRAMNAEKRKDLFVTIASDEKLAYEQFLLSNRITTGPVLHNRWSTVDC